jgi:hypothetical protein
MNIKKFAEKIAELHYPNKPNAIIDEPYRKVRMKTLAEQIEREFEILNLAFVTNLENIIKVKIRATGTEIFVRYDMRLNRWCNVNTKPKQWYKREDIDFGD